MQTGTEEQLRPKVKTMQDDKDSEDDLPNPTNQTASAMEGFIVGRKW